MKRKWTGEVRDLSSNLHTGGNCSSRNGLDGQNREKNNGLVQNSTGMIAHRSQPEERKWPRRERDMARVVSREPASSFTKEKVTDGVTYCRGG